VTDQGNHPLHARQLAALESAFHQGSADASESLAKWIGRPSLVEIDSLEQLPLEEATGVLTDGLADGLTDGDEPICFCTTELQGLLTGEMILAFDDVSGLALADMLLDQPRGTATEWTEMAVSAALETTNILCCAYSNTLSRSFCRSDDSSVLLPSPPKFSRDFAESLLEFALMGQAIVSDQVILTRTTFTIDSVLVNWTLLFIPDAESTSQLLERLVRNGS
jgi:chemotaxis protein CheC